MDKTAAGTVAGCLLRRHEEVEGAFVVDRHLRVAEVTLAVSLGRCEEGVGQLLGVVQGVGAGGIAQPFADVAVVYQAGGIESIEQSVVLHNGAGADGFLPFFVNAERNGMVLPVDEVGCRAHAPLVTAQSAKRTVMSLVQQPIEVVGAVVGEWNAVAHEILPALWSEVLHMVGLPRRVVAAGCK